LFGNSDSLALYGIWQLRLGDCNSILDIDGGNIFVARRFKGGSNGASAIITAARS